VEVKETKDYLTLVDVDQNIAVNSKNVPYKGDPPIQTVFDFS
jgi:hypothetical protein